MDVNLTRAFFTYVASNRTPDGKPPDYGIIASRDPDDKSKIDLTLILKSGVRYCCAEPGCHLGFFTEKSWRQLRHYLGTAGFAVSFPMKIHLKGIVERSNSVVTQDIGKETR